MQHQSCYFLLCLLWIRAVGQPIVILAAILQLDANGWATRSTFCQDTTIKVYEDVGDYSNDEDFTPSKITFYLGVCGEEISKGEVVLFDEE